MEHRYGWRGKLYNTHGIVDVDDDNNTFGYVGDGKGVCRTT